MRNSWLIAMVLLAVYAVTLAAAGPRSLTVTYYSDPAGATLYANQNQQSFGYAPAKLKYKVSKGFRDGKECMTLQPVMVRWASGAEASVSTITACPQNGGNQQFTLVRPTGVEGRELDVQFALQLQELALVREQARAARRDMAAAQVGAFWRTYIDTMQRNHADMMQRIREQNRLVQCRSQVIGQAVYTNCS